MRTHHRVYSNSFWYNHICSYNKQWQSKNQTNISAEPNVCQRLPDIINNFRSHCNLSIVTCWRIKFMKYYVVKDQEFRYFQDAVDWKIFERKTKEQRYFLLKFKTGNWKYHTLYVVYLKFDVWLRIVVYIWYEIKVSIYYYLFHIFDATNKEKIQKCFRMFCLFSPLLKLDITGNINIQKIFL